MAYVSIINHHIIKPVMCMHPHEVATVPMLGTNFHCWMLPK